MAVHVEEWGISLRVSKRPDQKVGLCRSCIGESGGLMFTVVSNVAVHLGRDEEIYT